MSIFNRVVNVHTWPCFLSLLQEYDCELICRQPLNSNWIKGCREQLDCDRNGFGQFQIRFILCQFAVWKSDYDLLSLWTPWCTSIELNSLAEMDSNSRKMIEILTWLHSICPTKNIRNCFRSAHTFQVYHRPGKSPLCLLWQDSTVFASLWH